MTTVNWRNNSLSKLCLGTVQFGLDYGIANDSGQISLEEAFEILNYSSSSNINCFDTAPGYGNSEAVLEEFFKTNFSNNNFIISKMTSCLFEKEREEFLKEINKSVKNNKKLFALLLHDNKSLFSWSQENTKYVNLLKEKKLINYFGASIYTDEEFEKALYNDNIDVIQIPFNIFDQRAISNKWLEKAKRGNKLIFVRSIYLQGLLLMNSNNLPNQLLVAKKHLKKLNKYSKELNISKNELCLSFVNQLASDSVLLFGCDNVKQAKENIKLFNNLNLLNERILRDLKKDFSSIEEFIYNPIKWDKK